VVFHFLICCVFLFVFPGIEGKVKAAFTRAYNKEAHMTPYAAGAVKKGKSKDTTEDVEAAPDGDEDGLAGEEDDDEEQSEDPSLDAMIKVKKESKKTAASKSSSSGAAAASKKKTGAPAATRGRGPGSRGGRGKKAPE
jgi:replication factor C subunit 1